MVRRMMPWLLASGIFAVAAVALQVGVPGSRVYVEPSGPLPDATPVAAPETLALPHLEPGATLGAVSAAFAPGVTPRRVTPSWRPEGEAWEWTEPAGRYAVVEFVNGGLAVAQVRRPWSVNLPAVEASSLPALHRGESRGEIERAIGKGWPVGLTVGEAGAGEVETCAWSIRDRGVGTGAVLWIGFQDGHAMAIEQPWGTR